MILPLQMRSLRCRVMEAPVQHTQVAPVDMYGQPAAPLPHTAGGTKRRLYFLVFVALSQPVLMLYVSYHLISSSVVADPSMKSAPL